MKMKSKVKFSSMARLYLVYLCCLFYDQCSAITTKTAPSPSTSTLTTTASTGRSTKQQTASSTRNGILRPSTVDSDEKRLTRDLFHNYDPALRPVFRKEDNVTVILGISAHQIIDVDEKNQIIKTSLWIRQIWYNPFLRWNKSYYGDIAQINVNPSQVWKPDLVLYNNADSSNDGSLENFKTRIKLFSDGRNMWLAPVIFSSSCKIRIQYFPFDQQFCKLKFGSWTFDGFQLDMKPEAASAGIGKFQDNGEWDLVGVPAKRNEEYYDCCEAPYPDITFTIHIRRRVLFFLFNLIIPCLVIVLLTSLSFYLPPDSGERISVVITNLLAMTVFMLIVAELLPPTSDEVSIISVFYSCCIFEVGIALLGTCVVLKYHFCSTYVHKMPNWVRIVVIQGLGRLFCKLPKESTFKQPFCKPVSKDKEEHTMTDSFLSRNDSLPHRNAIKDRRFMALKTLSNSERGSNASMNAKLDEDGRSRGAPYSTHKLDELMNEPAFDRSVIAHAMLGKQEIMSRNLAAITNSIKDSEEDAKVKEEWQLAASILDNFFCWLFLLSIVLSSFVLYIRVREARSVDQSEGA